MDKREKEFLENIGHGRDIYTCESDNDRIDEMLAEEEEQTEKLKKGK